MRETLSAESLGPEPAAGSPPAWIAWSLSALLAVLACAAMGFLEPRLMLLVPLGLAGLLVSLRWPNLGTLFVVFLLYTNAPAVAVKFHGVPFAAAAVFPLLLLIPFAHYAVQRREGLVLPAATPFVIGFFVIQGIGVIFSEYPTEALEAWKETLLEGLLIYFLIANVVRTKRTLRNIVWTLLLAGIVIGGIPLLQQLTGAHGFDFGGFGQLSDTAFRTGIRTDRGELTQFRLTGPIGEQNRYAQIMLMLVPLTFYGAWSARSGGRRLLGLAALVAVAAGFALAFSRGAAVAAVLLVALALLMGLIPRKHVLLAGVLGLGLVLAFPQYRARLVSITNVTKLVSGNDTGAQPDGAMKGRATAMLAAVHVTADHPLIGVGPGVFRNYSQSYGNQLNLRRLKEGRQAHCLYLDIAAENGLLGLGALLGIFAATILSLQRARRAWMEVDPDMSYLMGALLLCVVAYMSSGLFLHLSYVRYFWFVMGLAGAAARIMPGRSRVQVPRALAKLAR